VASELLIRRLGTIDEATQQLFSNPESRPRYLAGIFNHGVYATSTFSSVHAGLASASLGPVSTGSSRSANMNSQSPTIADLIVQCPALKATFISEQETLHIQLTKLAINAIINPLSAIFDCFNGEIFQSPRIRILIDLMIEEVSAVILAILRSKTPNIDPLVYERFSVPQLTEIIDRVGEQTAKNISSMRQDLLAKRQTEIEYINGYVVRQGVRFDIPVPLNKKVVGFVKDRRVVAERDTFDVFEISKK
jgi:2-dehydropantoate 2-reductase